MTSTVISSSVVLIKNHTSVENQDKEVRDIFQSNSPGVKKSWNIENLTYIKNNLNYIDQSRESDLSGILRTIQQNSAVQYIKNIKTATNIGDLNVSEYYSGMDTIQFINTTYTIDQLLSSYKNRYSTNQDDISAWSSVNVIPTIYYAKDLNGNSFHQLNGIPSFTTKNIDSIADKKLAKKINDMYELQKIKIKAEYIRPEGYLEIPDENFYEIIFNTYDQQTNDVITPIIKRNQIVVRSQDANDYDTNSGEITKFIDNSTIDFWIDFIMNPLFEDYSRIVVEPANLIIYRSNPSNPSYDIPLSDRSVLNLISQENPTFITMKEWAKSCINANPSTDFDFRYSLYRNGLSPSLIQSINIPRIITINQSTYDKNKHNWKEPTLIPPSILYAEKPAGEPNRNWGNNYFESLKNITVSMNSYAPNLPNPHGFNINHVNETRVKSDYTNAESNTSNQVGSPDLGSGPSASEIFANQFFVAPNLISYNTTSLQDFFNNFNFINQLPIYYKYNEPNFSLASYSRYKDLSVNFLPEKWNEDSSFNGFTLKNSIFNNDRYSSSTSYLTEYFNFLANNRYQNLESYVYKYFNVVQNQWLVSPPVIHDATLKNGYRYDFMYGISDLLQRIAYPFSMYETILNQKNDLYVENTYNIQVQGKHISRYVDPTTSTIVYSNQIVSGNKKLVVCPPFYVSNDTFANFIEAKRTNKNLAIPEQIDITFDDWVANTWTDIDPNLDIIKILAEKNTTIGTLEIPKIVMVNNNSVAFLEDYVVDKNLVTSIILISLIVVIVLIEIFIIVRICRTSSYYKWSLTKAQDEYGY